MKPLAHWPSKYKNEVEICGDTSYQIKRECETAMKRFLTLTIYFDLGKPNTKSFRSMFNLNQLYFREIFLIRFACKNTNRKSDCNMEKNGEFGLEI